MKHGSDNILPKSEHVSMMCIFRQRQSIWWWEVVGLKHVRQRQSIWWWNAPCILIQGRALAETALATAPTTLH